MKISRKEVIQELNQYIILHQEKIKFLKSKTDVELQKTPVDGGWNVFECIEHLNQYGRYYIPEIKTAIKKYSGPESETFQSGWIGNYFALAMLPSSNKKMKAMKAYNPKGKLLGREVLEEFDRQLTDLINILKQCNHTNLTKIKCNISLTNFLKLRLGDTLRVVIYHNERHLLQAERAI